MSVAFSRPGLLCAGIAPPTDLRRLRAGALLPRTRLAKGTCYAPYTGRGSYASGKESWPAKRACGDERAEHRSGSPAATSQIAAIRWSARVQVASTESCGTGLLASMRDPPLQDSHPGPALHTQRSRIPFRCRERPRRCGGSQWLSRYSGNSCREESTPSSAPLPAHTNSTLIVLSVGVRKVRERQIQRRFVLITIGVPSKPNCSRSRLIMKRSIEKCILSALSVNTTKVGGEWMLASCSKCGCRFQILK